MARHEIPLLKRLALAALCTALPALGVAADASLHVYGAVQRELRLDLTALRQLPAQDSGKLAMVCQSCSAARNSSACCAINPTRLVFQWWKRNFRIARRVPPGYPN
ncbi:TPA: hypothetical protein VDV94_001451 [Pseudomonas aeruginosa]|nr:hypothetical protein [Pseudomonas aeruginosa]